MAASGKAGASRPAATGKLAGSQVFSYVWPTTLDPAIVGFEPKAGILAFAVTAHPDFDDTPLFDENGNGDLADDGDVWHSHWVVLAKDDAYEEARRCLRCYRIYSIVTAKSLTNGHEPKLTAIAG